MKTVLAASLMVAATTMIATDAADARGMYCSRHRAACRERDARAAKQREADRVAAEKAAEEERQFQAGLAARLTLAQMAELQRREKHFSAEIAQSAERENRLFTDKMMLSDQVSELKRRVDGMWSAPAALIFGLIFALGGVAIGAALAGDTRP